MQYRIVIGELHITRLQHHIEPHMLCLRNPVEQVEGLAFDRG